MILTNKRVKIYIISLNKGGKIMGQRDEAQEDEYARCRECMAAFQKELGSFDPKMCRFCDYGAELHRKEVLNGDLWRSVDWNNFRYKDFYGEWTAPSQGNLIFLAFFCMWTKNIFSEFLLYPRQKTKKGVNVDW